MISSILIPKSSAKSTRKTKKSHNFFAARRNIQAQREKDESCTSKRRQKQGNYFEINRFPTV